MLEGGLEGNFGCMNPLKANYGDNNSHSPVRVFTEEGLNPSSVPTQAQYQTCGCWVLFKYHHNPCSQSLVSGQSSGGGPARVVLGRGNTGLWGEEIASLWIHGGWIAELLREHVVMIWSQPTPHKKNSNINKQKKKKTHVKAKGHPLQYSAGFFVLEGIVWSGDAHKEGVVSGVFTAVVHKVCRGLGYLQKQWQGFSGNGASKSPI